MSIRRVYAQIDLSAIEHNIETIYAHMPIKKPIMAVIKADGYGHGALELARRLEGLECVYGYAAATAEEALKIRSCGLNKPILILGYVFDEDCEQLIANDISLTVFTHEAAKILSDIAVRLDKTVRIHIKVDTGMSRIGVCPNEEGVKIVQSIAALPNVYLEGLFTHYARADEEDKSSAVLQLEKYIKFKSSLDEIGISFEKYHTSNSAATLEMPDAHFDIVRAGIVMYGLWPSDEVDRSGIDLRPAMSLKSHVVYVKTVPEGTPISYGGTYVTDRVTRVATIPVGYADGYPRSLSSKGRVLINGQSAPILGRVCMDQMMVDVTDIGDVSINDQVVLLGRAGDEEITAEEIGSISGRFNYELVCDISPRVPRVYKS